jgi:hypothetical protein
MINEYGSVDRESRNTWRRCALQPLCPPIIAHDLTWDRTKVAAGKKLVLQVLQLISETVIFAPIKIWSLCNDVHCGKWLYSGGNNILKMETRDSCETQLTNSATKGCHNRKVHILILISHGYFKCYTFLVNNLPMRVKGSHRKYEYKE